MESCEKKQQGWCSLSVFGCVCVCACVLKYIWGEPIHSTSSSIVSLAIFQLSWGPGLCETAGVDLHGEATDPDAQSEDRSFGIESQELWATGLKRKELGLGFKVGPI